MFGDFRMQDSPSSRFPASGRNSIHYFCLIAIIAGFILNVVFYHYSRGYQKFLIVDYDDAYISMRYAQNLVDGHGLIWNAGEPPVEGYTNFLWVLSLALVGKLGGSMVLWSKILGTAFAAFGIALAYLVANYLCPRDNWNIAGHLAAFTLAFNPAYVYWAGSGMETPFFAFLLVLGLFVYLKEGAGAKRYMALSVVMALAAMTRPDGLLFFGIMILHALSWHLVGDRRLSAKDMAGALLPFLLIFVPYFLWRVSYYGYLLPNTFYAKTGAGLYAIVVGSRYLADFLKSAPWVFSMLLTPLLLPKQKFQLSFIYACLAPYTLYIVLVGGDFMPLFRFFLHIMPWFAIYLGVILSEFREHVSKGQEMPAKKLPVFVSACLLLAYFNSHTLYASAYRISEGEKQTFSRLVAIGQHLEQGYPPAAVAAVFPAGAISYYSGLKIIDMYGLSDMHIAHLKEPNLGDLDPATSSLPPFIGAQGHFKTDIPYVLARKPTLLIGTPDLTRIPTRASKWDVEEQFKSYDRDEYELVVEKLVFPGDPFFDRGIFMRYLRLRSFQETPR